MNRFFNPFRVSKEECMRFLRIITSFVVLVAAVSASGGGAKSAAAIPDFSVSQLDAPAGANWISENGNLQSWRYSTLSQITAANGAGLQVAWDTHLANPATPERVACVLAPPSSSADTFSPVTVRMTSGPVMNIRLVPSTMKTKSVSAGE